MRRQMLCKTNSSSPHRQQRSLHVVQHENQISYTDKSQTKTRQEQQRQQQVMRRPCSQPALKNLDMDAPIAETVRIPHTLSRPTKPQGSADRTHALEKKKHASPRIAMDQIKQPQGRDMNKTPIDPYVEAVDSPVKSSTTVMTPPLPHHTKRSIPLSPPQSTTTDHQ